MQSKTISCRRSR